MMTEFTTRWALPLLVAGQAQKEMSHNEALAAIDLLLHPAVEAVGVNAPPPDPMRAQSWIVGTAPTGAWQGRAGMLAGWSDAGWRFAEPRAGMIVWSLAEQSAVRWLEGRWQMSNRVAIAAPAGGATVDTEARAALAAILDTLRNNGLVAR